ncbi:FKBP-type peptidyl-prolyl cis-trans isomerase [Marinobacter bryozoorum]|uniref:FKBP-type peptidyl-prolyl cis-trans isomerase n=1 Tax=Marinobacter bryozoorum TaxID=256324 RepID=UPI0020050423|nr:FKBP-type peptidyl-prolyl cis-trans isomerase [Marinobacter bryozoorum]MCK7546287.1 FKBP-type peptidyl-prolyl cis-trans isomerase [Marinobacter bryozoorum]
MNVPSNVHAVILTGLFLAGTFSQPALSRNAKENQGTFEARQTGFEDLNDRFSYAYGYDLAEKFKAEGLALNVDLMAEAMQAVFQDGEAKMSAGEVAATLEVFREIQIKQKEAERTNLAEKNKKEGEAFLAENATRDDVVVTDSGLQYKVIANGNGDYTPSDNDEVTVNYRGMFVDGTEFDSTYERNEPYTVKVKQLIPGWIEALKLMSEGAKWELYIPAAIAYGERGSGNYVGPNSTLIFEVELLEIKRTDS